MLASLTWVLGLLVFFTQYVHPLSSGWTVASWQPIGSIVPTVGGYPAEIPYLFQAPVLGGLMLQSALLVGFALVALSRARLPFGAMTLFIGLITVMMVLMRQRWVADIREPLLVAALLGGLGADVLLRLLRPSFSQPMRLRIFAAALPMLVYGVYFVVLLASAGMWWSVHLWTGAIFLAGVVGWLLAALVTLSPAGSASAPGSGAVFAASAEVSKP
jgi:hypothetical protein